MSDGDHRRIDPARIGLGQSLPPSPESIEALRQRYAQAAKLLAPRPKQRFATVLQRQQAAGPAAPGGGRFNAQAAGRTAAPASDRPQGQAAAAGPPAGGAAPTLPAPPPQTAPAVPPRHSLGDPGATQRFRIKTPMRIVFKG